MPLDAAALEAELSDASAPAGLPFAAGRGTVALRWDKAEKRPAVLVHLDGGLVAAERFDVMNARARDRFSEHVPDTMRSELTAALLTLGAQPAPPRDEPPRPRAVLIAHAEPWGESVALADTLAVLRAQLVRHAVLPTHADVALTLWCAATHFLEHVHFFGILHVMSAVRESGKSRVLELVHLASARAWSVVQPSVATLFRVIEASAPTLILDEADTLSRESVADITAVLNDGVRRGGCVPRAVEQADGSFAVEGFAIFCPKVLGSIGAPFSDATISRTIRVTMERAAPDALKALSPFRSDHAEHRWAHELRRRFARTAQDDGPRLAALLEAAADDVDAVPLPSGVDGRQAQVWEPLVALADIAGGEWPAIARTACLHFVGALRAAEPADAKVRLLGDLRTFFTVEYPMREFATSEQMLEYLTADESRGWREYRKGHPLTPHQLARLLKPFGVSPSIVRAAELPNGRARAWARAALSPVWERLAPTERDGVVPPTSVPSVQSVASVTHDSGGTVSRFDTDVTLLGTTTPNTFESAGPGLHAIADDAGYLAALLEDAA